MLQTLSAFDLRELAIEAPQRDEPILAGNFQNEEIGEAYALIFAKPLQCCFNNVRIMDGKVLVVKQHCNRLYHLFTRAPVD